MNVSAFSMLYDSFSNITITENFIEVFIDLAVIVKLVLLTFVMECIK